MMTLNFARVPFRNERLSQLIFSIAAIGLVAATVVHGVVLTRYLQREREELDSKVQAYEEEVAEVEESLSRKRIELDSKKNEARDERIRFLSSIYRQKNFSWTGLFNELESISPAAVRITSIAPTEIAGDLLVRLSIVGRSLEDVLEMVTRLEASRLFETVLPMDEMQEGDGGTGGVEATLSLRFLPSSTRGETLPEPERKLAANDDDASAAPPETKQRETPPRNR